MPLGITTDTEHLVLVSYQASRAWVMHQRVYSPEGPTSDCANGYVCAIFITTRQRKFSETAAMESRLSVSPRTRHALLAPAAQRSEIRQLRSMTQTDSTVHPLKWRQPLSARHRIGCACLAQRCRGSRRSPRPAYHRSSHLQARGPPDSRPQGTCPCSR